jgi:hypothetical protein
MKMTGKNVRSVSGSPLVLAAAGLLWLPFFGWRVGADGGGVFGC